MWEEVKTAAEVVKRGTVSSAADALGVHRATVNRRIDSLEAHIGGKLFQRHNRGYTPTELGFDLLRIANHADDQLEQLRRRATHRDEALQGNLIVTSIDGIAPLVLPKIAAFTAMHSGMTLTFLASNKPLQLELGEAHVAFRLGAQPDDPDYVVLPVEPLSMGLYASESYITQYGMPHEGNLADHRFALPNLSPKQDPPDRWLRELVSTPNLALVGDKAAVVDTAIKAGIGVGFMPVLVAKEDPSLVEVMEPKPSWCEHCWIVTHVDLHRSPKVQAFLEHCRSEE